MEVGHYKRIGGLKLERWAFFCWQLIGYLPTAPIDLSPNSVMIHPFSSCPLPSGTAPEIHIGGPGSAISCPVGAGDDRSQLSFWYAPYILSVSFVRSREWLYNNSVYYFFQSNFHEGCSHLVLNLFGHPDPGSLTGSSSVGYILQAVVYATY